MSSEAQGREPLSSLRTTQRPPRSCQPCASRRVKCDKTIPCANCVRRGETEACRRETVLVRGRVTVAADEGGSPAPYDAVLRENERLKQQLALQSCADLPVHGSAAAAVFEETDTPASLLGDAAPRQTRCKTWHDILLPARECSDRLVAHDKVWNSWVHYAVEYPRFETQCSQFRDAVAAGVALEDMDASWLAIYFAVIAAALLVMNDEETRALNLPHDHETMLQNWFDASVFCLYQADFMRRWTVQSVQAIAVLGVLFVTLGEHQLYVTMWTCALRIAHKIDLHRLQSESLSAEGHLRLWWTLIICDWLAMPHHPPVITEADFDAQLPTVDVQGQLATPDGSSIHPVQYHIFMARTAQVYARFRHALQHSRLPVGDVVRHADEQLAEIINTLPRHLQPEESSSRWTKQVQGLYPWVSWQRYDITVVLLHHRLRINRALQHAWRADPAQYGWARAICIDTSRDSIWISNHWDQPVARRRQWALTLHLFTAAMFLLQECGTADLEKCLLYFDQVKPYSVVAARAADVLRNALI